MPPIPTDVPPPPASGEHGRLDSWKKIAGHFRRDVTTVQRWERREGMPVHRHLHDKQGSVYAFRAELEAWWESRRGRLPEAADEPAQAEPPSASAVLPAAPEPAMDRDRHASGANGSGLGRRVGAAALVVLALAVGLILLKAGFPGPRPWRNPLATATFTRLTDWPGIEQAAEISGDGAWVAFLADHDGPMDAWVARLGTGSFRNLTRGRFGELVNPAIRTLGFSPDAARVTVWTRRADGSGPEDIRLMSVPTGGGEVKEFLPGVAEASWSHDGRRVTYHTTAPGDPLYVRDLSGVSRRFYVAPEGVHCHFPLWSADDSYVYFVRGVPPGAWDIWRIRPSGADLERITFLESRVSHPVLLDAATLAFLATDGQGAGPWLYAVDLRERAAHRVSFGLERYSSLSAAASGRRLVATVNESSSSIWQAPLEPGARAPDSQAALRVAAGSTPRAGPGYLLYVAASQGRQGIWKLAAGQSRPLWSGANSEMAGAPAIAPDGKHIAFIASEAGSTTLYEMDSDGTGLRGLTRALPLRGDPAWAPDGRSIVAAVYRDGAPRLTRIFLDGTAPVPLVAEYSIDPVWSPDGRFLIYSGADVGTTFPLRAVANDGRPYQIPPLILTRGARHVVFQPDAAAIVILRGDIGHKSLWRVDLRTGAQQQLTDFAGIPDIGDFDLAGDGAAVVFDRVQETSHIALIERGG